MLRAMTFLTRKGKKLLLGNGLLVIDYHIFAYIA